MCTPRLWKVLVERAQKSTLAIAVSAHNNQSPSAFVESVSVAEREESNAGL
jgi:hypothetical protein